MNSSKTSWNLEIKVDPDLTTMPLHTNGKKAAHRRSEQVEEIISHKPGFVEKWAIVFILLILLLLLGSTWFIRYSDTIEAPATLTALNPPRDVPSPVEGRLVRLMVKEDNLVKKDQLLGWIDSTALYSPITGKVTLLVPPVEGQFIQKGVPVAYITPDNPAYYAEIRLPQINFGKIDTGLSVQFRFAAYPYREYGYLEGKLDFISKVPSDSNFLATARFEQGLVTNLNKLLKYNRGLRAQAVVITRKRRLLQRIWSTIVPKMSL